jgi:hypothetical protein
MGAALGVADAQEVRAAVHGERQEPADLFDERSITFFF